MKHSHSTYPSFLKFCAAAVITTGPLLASAGVPDFHLTPGNAKVVNTTDRMIVKYKDASMAMTSSANAPAASVSRLASVQRVGQQFGLNMSLLHTTATGAQIVALMRRLQREQGVSFLFASHDTSLIAGADTVINLRDGALQASDAGLKQLVEA